MKNFTKVFAKDHGIKRFKETLKNKKIVKLFVDNKQESDIYSGLFDKRSWLDDEQVWHVYPYAIKEHNHHDSKTTVDVHIICPLCGMVHVHGTDIENDDIKINDSFFISDDKKHPRYSRIGHRVYHCSPHLWTTEKSKVNHGYVIEDITISQTLRFNN